MLKKVKNSIYLFFQIDPTSRLINLLTSEDDETDSYVKESRALVQIVVGMDFEERGLLQHQVNKYIRINKRFDISYEQAVANSKTFFKDVHWWQCIKILPILKSMTVEELLVEVVYFCDCCFSDCDYSKKTYTTALQGLKGEIAERSEEERFVVFDVLGRLYRRLKKDIKKKVQEREIERLSHFTNNVSVFCKELKAAEADFQKSASYLQLN